MLGIADCMIGRGHAQRALGDVTKAIEDYSSAERCLNTLAESGEAPSALRKRAYCLVCRGNALTAVNECMPAIRDYDLATNIYLQLRQERRSSSALNAMLADCAINRANAQRRLKLSFAVRGYDNAIDICHQIRGGSLERAGVILLGRAYFNRSIAHAIRGTYMFALLDLYRTRKCVILAASTMSDQLRDLMYTNCRSKQTRIETHRGG